ncbi:putative methylesterase 13, chloroplastic-like protein [Corchorus olitorius]|uniref:Methylesterase 13, chloroplastic-like protein n=1 Tax=Corchorus olitorius TaxID=93759 RepID=A0A1R3HP31_9ROSI|nr:putative methylesterase 13, chloroplastic-like protein [Corchorus olitorius]
MGNAFGCINPDQNSSSSTSPKRGSRKNKSKRRSLSESLDHLEDHEAAMIREQAMAAALLFRQQQRNNSLPFNRSTSVVHPSPASGSKKQASHNFPRSSSSRPRSVSDPMIRPQQLLHGQQEVKFDGLETNHFVLVHGGGFGAWCWYKTMTLLEENGFKVDAVDLTGSGINSFDTNNITSLAQYVKPLTDIFDKLEDGKKVILVGHDFGGACISYVMELYPSKIAKAVFVAAAMLSSGQSTLDMFSQQMDSNDLMRQAQVFLYANGNNNPPTAVDLDKTSLKDLFFNQTSAKDVALASVSMRPIPFAPVLEKLSLSDMNYGSIRRFYIKTQEDSAITLTLQEAMIKSNPPEQVFQLKGSDHAPFFSRPQGLHKMLVEIAQIPSNKQASSSTTIEL